MPSYKVECHRVWLRTVEAASRKEAQRIAQEEMSEEPDAEDYSYSIVKREIIDRDSGGAGHNSVWGS